MQERTAGLAARRVLAAFACAWLVVCSALGLRHEAQVAHVVDPHTGELRHAERLVGDHTGTQPDYHAAPAAHADLDACALASALHQATHHATARALVGAPPLALAESPPRAASSPVAAALYRLAPKTSPPARA